MQLIFRLTPPLVAVMLLHIFLVHYLTSGPIWPRILDVIEGSCSKYWWSVLLYTQNYVNPEDICIEQSWYLSADMQLYVMSPLLLFPLVKWPKFGIVCLLLCCITSQIATFFVTFIYGFHGVTAVAG